jgi:6-phosphogluconolactonase (cycloisomerase 2 family)
LAFRRGADGSLTLAKTIPTGGKGTGSGLGSAGALASTDDNQWLFVVNAGSNDISVISLRTFNTVTRVNSGGTMPISVTVYGDLVYVLNAGGSGNISGFSFDDAHLRPIRNSTRPLSGSGVGPAQVQFSPDGRVLVVTEKSTSLIDTYTVDEDGRALGPSTHPSSGPTPFGFDFGKNNTLVVSEAANSAASSYRVSGNGGVNLISGSVLNGQAAACWVVVTNNGRYAYTADAHNGKISLYGVANNGALTLIQAIAGAPGGGPLDEAVSQYDQFLYVINPSLGQIDAFAIASDGSLTPLTGASGIPSSAVGIVAR